jgi:hypothetical protein
MFKFLKKKLNDKEKKEITDKEIKDIEKYIQKNMKNVNIASTYYNEQIKKYDNIIEEVNKMGKFKLENGKLVKNDETEVKQNNVPNIEPVMEENIEEDTYEDFSQPEIEPEIPNNIQGMPNPFIKNNQQQMRQPVMPQQNYQQPVMPQEIENVLVDIKCIDNSIFTIGIPENELNEALKGLAQIINNEKAFVIGDNIIVSNNIIAISPRRE